MARYANIPYRRPQANGGKNVLHVADVFIEHDHARLWLISGVIRD
ncbi:4334_t:CDS:2 [Ambispora gerdemannii]|uniref:4334_t:CDS:1 n=1 Tax=Ambispora gerdemannii TaxID=144530 RepID=A0A9N9DK43_9GLOM|nr:4334_t:CDS:2 [Ambispora gerdemannii]